MIKKNIVKSYVGIHLYEFIYEFMSLNSSVNSATIIQAIEFMIMNGKYS